MTTRGRGRVQKCGAAEARRRLDHARQFLAVAELAAGEHSEDGSLEYGNAAASLSVLAGIAAVDAACCATLGERSRGDDHLDAATLVGQLAHGGTDAGNRLRRLLSVKDDAQYGFTSVSGQELRGAIRQAGALVEFAGEILAR